MIDSTPDAPQAYVQMVDKSDVKVNSLLDEAVSRCHDDRCRERLSQAIQGIYQRGYQAYIPRDSLRRFDVTAPQDPNHPIEPMQTTIMRHGAFSEAVGLEDYAKQYEEWIQKGRMKEINNPRKLTGQAWDTQDDPGGLHDCIVTLNIEGKGPLHNYTLPTMPVLFPQQMTNFMMGAHESEHCLYRADQAPTDTADPKYASSVLELAADLSAALYYARETGSFDIYPLLIRPMRLANPTDLGHTTANALNELLRGLDPQEFKGVDPELIQKQVLKSMAENFEDELGYIKTRDDTHPSPAQQVMVKEMAIRERYVDYQSGMQWPWKSLGDDTKSYSRDILLSLRRNHLAFRHLGNDAEQGRAAFAYGKFVERWGIEDVNDSLALTRVLQPKEKDPKLDRVLDVMMGL